MRELDFCSINLQGNKEEAAKHIRTARTLLGRLKSYSQGLETNFFKKTINGIEFYIGFIKDRNYITIVSPPIIPNPSEFIHGLVYIPASDDAPIGWGHPVDETNTPLGTPAPDFGIENVWDKTFRDKVDRFKLHRRQRLYYGNNDWVYYKYRAGGEKYVAGILTWDSPCYRTNLHWFDDRNFTPMHNMKPLLPNRYTNTRIGALECSNKAYYNGKILYEFPMLNPEESTLPIFQGGCIRRVTLSDGTIKRYLLGVLAPRDIRLTSVRYGVQRRWAAIAVDLTRRRDPEYSYEIIDWIEDPTEHLPLSIEQCNFLFNSTGTECISLVLAKRFNRPWLGGDDTQNDEGAITTVKVNFDFINDQFQIRTVMDQFESFIPNVLHSESEEEGDDPEYRVFVRGSSYSRVLGSQIIYIDYDQNDQLQKVLFHLDAQYIQERTQTLFTTTNYFRYRIEFGDEVLTFNATYTGETGGSGSWESGSNYQEHHSRIEDFKRPILFDLRYNYVLYAEIDGYYQDYRADTWWEMGRTGGQTISNNEGGLTWVKYRDSYRGDIKVYEDIVQDEYQQITNLLMPYSLYHIVTPLSCTSISTCQLNFDQVARVNYFLWFFTFNGHLYGGFPDRQLSSGFLAQRCLRPTLAFFPDLKNNKVLSLLSFKFPANSTSLVGVFDNSIEYYHNYGEVINNTFVDKTSEFDDLNQLTGENQRYVKVGII